MRAQEFIIEYNVAKPVLNTGQAKYNGIIIKYEANRKEQYLIIQALSPQGKKLGSVKFLTGPGGYSVPLRNYRELEAENLVVDEKYRGQGIAQTMYDFVKSHGYKIYRSDDQTDDGAYFWDKNRGNANVWESELNEISDEKLQDYLSRAGSKVDRRMTRMAQARDRLNKGYEIYHADSPNKVVDRFEARTPAEAQRYYNNFISKYESDVDYDLRLRRATGIMEVAEGLKDDIKLSHNMSPDMLYVHATIGDSDAGGARFKKIDGAWTGDIVHVYPQFRRQGVATKIYDYAEDLVGKIIPSKTLKSKGKKFWANRDKQGVAEAFDQPYPIKWEKSEHGDYDALATLGDGTYLSIMFNNEGDDEYQIEFHRNNSQAVTGEGDAQRVFATVLNAIQQFLKVEQPWKFIFSASKEVEPGQNAQSRAKLYDRLMQRYASAWGYDVYHEDHGDQITYELTKKKSVAENFADGKKPGRKGLAKRMGVNCKQSVSKLRKIAKNSSGERARMAHWCANMKAGKKNK